MDDNDICPPWWPDWLWWWLHHHPRPKGEPEPPYLEVIREPIESLLLGLQAYAGALPVGSRADTHLLGQVQQMAVGEMHAAVERLAEAVKAQS